MLHGSVKGQMLASEPAACVCITSIYRDDLTPLLNYPMYSTMD